jgi:hypothetical protein
MLKGQFQIQRFAEKGEKTGWYYLEFSSTAAETINPGVKVIFKVRGTIDNNPFEDLAFLPMGKGSFIMPLNAGIRKKIDKSIGDTVWVELELDTKQYELNTEFISALETDTSAYEFFKSLSGSHQRYFSKWIDSAKTLSTRERRIIQAVVALSRSMGYPEMLRESKRLK